MLRLVIILIYLFACYRWGDWKNWKEYYPTILYVIIGDISYNFIFYDHTLWSYVRLVNHTFSDFLVAFTVFPSAIILFLTHYPKKPWKQISYIILWTVISTLVEYISVNAGYFSYSGGWSILWSMGVFFIAFLLTRLHYKHPLVVWPISSICALATMFIFKVPISSLK